jgi:endonuclease/exonuclease/phosphatase (EEP) superfamily protein YafD
MAEGNKPADNLYTMSVLTKPEARSDFLRVRIRVRGLLVACGAILCAATILGFFGKAWWALDLFAHFRVQYFVGLSLLAMILLLSRQHRAAACFCVFGVVNLATIVPFYTGKSPPPANGSHIYRSLLINVNTHHGSPSRVARAIEKVAPDILVLLEVDEGWLTALGDALRPYPHWIGMPREDNFGIALYSRQPFVREEILHIGEAGVPSLLAELDMRDGRLAVLATHPLPPSGGENSRLRNDQLNLLAAIARDSSVPLILVGDLNATPWSWPYRQLLRDSGLRDSAMGRGLIPTWPTFMPPLLIPIDHFLHSDKVHVSKRSVGPRTGSDHYPLLVEFALASVAEN